MARIVVCGYMIRYPVAGMLLAYLHYVLGLHRLGHEVVYLEESGWPRSCYDPVGCDYGDKPDVGLRTVHALLARYQVKIPVCYVDRQSGSLTGTDWETLRRWLREADLLLNVGGVCWLPEFLACGRRAVVDMDPFFTQVGGFGLEGLNEHHVYFSYGANIGRPGCSIPAGGIDWQATVPPVVPEVWRGAVPGREERQDNAAGEAAFTTVANWSAYGGVSYSGEHYGQKDEEFLRLLDLPSRTSQRLELALSGGSAEIRKRLVAAGWSLRDGAEVSVDLPTYQAYIGGSRGEFSVAKHAYVKTRSGWFSDRSVCYLAAGLPVVLQDTGFSAWLPTGRGVLAFSSLDEAADCLESVNAEYPAHRRAAREIARQTFSDQAVLPRLLETALDTKRARPL